MLEYVIKANITAISANWVCELYCDLVGVGLLGPAFVCASSLFTLPGSDPDYCSQTHPPSRLRASQCIRYLFKNNPGFGYRRNRETLARAMVEPWETYVGKQVRPPSSVPYSIVFQAVSRLCDDTIREAKKAIGQANLFTPAMFQEWVEALVSRITDGLPPNEVHRLDGSTRIADFSAIVNAGWYVYLSGLSELERVMHQPENTYTKRRFYGLVSKGIESSELQQRWSEIKEHLEVGSS